ncbi:hypothetical protein [Saccharospirillum salsuginis]|uniref:Uncharacterized protein n=1 Tax=Saccharospirillum salsuginis TaxID=418750 RepID=A0A918NFP4_9GAMM|nr:hypothetical protein [Saccharospirillum salsuginis]GGX69508.1 hypothetical protein GCM10007392_41370 [Saccharospirillum salsuginis]
MGIRTADQIRQDWEINPRWHGVRRDYDAEQVAAVASDANLPHPDAHRSACRLWRWLHSDWPILLDRDPPPWQLRLSGVAKPIMGQGWAVESETDDSLCAPTLASMSDGAAVVFLSSDVVDIEALARSAAKCRFTADAVGVPLVIAAVVTGMEATSAVDSREALARLSGRVDVVVFDWDWSHWSDLQPYLETVPQGPLMGTLFRSAPSGRAAVNEALLQAGVKLIGTHQPPG